jgi:hypothetical protein
MWFRLYLTPTGIYLFTDLKQLCNIYSEQVHMTRLGSNANTSDQSAEKKGKTVAVPLYSKSKLVSHCQDGDSISGPPTRSQLLYRLDYPGPPFTMSTGSLSPG